MADLIDRQAAIDAVIRHLQLDYEYAWGVREAINALPPAQTERKRGHWTSDGNCSKCGEHAPFWAMASTYHTTPYCYNCGAKMERGTR